MLQPSGSFGIKVNTPETSYL